MANSWENRSIRSEDIVQIMRDINALQSDFGLKMTRYATDTFNSSPAIGTARICSDSSGNIYILGGIGGGLVVIKCDANMRYVTQWSVSSVTNNSTGIACSSSDLLYISEGDTSIQSLYVYDTDGVDQGDFALTTRTGHMINSVAMDANDNIYVTRIHTGTQVSFAEKYNSSGTMLSSLAGSRFHGICVDGDDSIYVIKSAGTVQVAGIYKYNQSWSLINTFGDSEIGFPYSITVDSSKNVYVIAEVSADIVYLEYDNTGTYVGTYYPPFGGTYRTIHAIGSRSVITSNGSILALLGIQTEWFSYTHTAQVSLGTPDAGIAVPTIDAVQEILSTNYFSDMRNAIEGICPYFDDGSGNDLSVQELIAAAVNRTDYGATGSVSSWTRPRQSMGDGHLVMGSDANDYWCLVAHTGTADTKPTTGASYATKWTANGTTGHGRAHIVGFQYESPGKIPATALSSVVEGDEDGNDYICDDDHEASSATRPTSGINWRSKWRSLSTSGFGETWLSGRRYYSNRVYDIDIGEIYDCVEYLKTATPL